mmetsp:Transcript_31960/g.69953  ORF Transcript_31960/g.69953 Transcript_31960/m.69953 type:complete len:113 (-) Transcript_31960:204-542(-)
MRILRIHYEMRAPAALFTFNALTAFNAWRTLEASIVSILSSVAYVRSATVVSARCVSKDSASSEPFEASDKGHARTALGAAEEAQRAKEAVVEHQRRARQRDAGGEGGNGIG